MAVTYDGGVIMGADSRTSTGTYVANRVSDKITSLHDYIYACRSGSAADTQAVADYVRYFLASHRLDVFLGIAHSSRHDGSIFEVGFLDFASITTV